jgi:hypothetical protein
LRRVEWDGKYGAALVPPFKTANRGPLARPIDTNLDTGEHLTIA